MSRLKPSRIWIPAITIVLGAVAGGAISGPFLAAVGIMLAWAINLGLLSSGFYDDRQTIQVKLSDEKKLALADRSN